ncbi:hypothetical protein [Thermaurantiacus tibetensis]|uniref:hypothetical protein n=1 Tax=Thermaurantiacus tibetensis TaxID=2759035 RepID=UPI00188E4AB3|nr:hypothetical protein [Thermaurantiacus tibetensis]
MSIDLHLLLAPPPADPGRRVAAERARLAAAARVRVAVTRHPEAAAPAQTAPAAAEAATVTPIRTRSQP